MVFECATCHARYRVDDSKLAGKVCRFTCPKCGQVHLLRDPRVHSQVVEAVPQAGKTKTDSKDQVIQPQVSTRHPTISEVRLTKSMPTVTTSPTPGRPTTVTAALPAVPGVPKQPTEAWFAIKRGQRIGPFKREDLLLLLKDGVLHERSFLWRPTMSAWTRLNEIAELADILETYRRERAEPSTPAPPPLPTDVEKRSAVAAGPTQETGTPHPVDALYAKISRPVIDLRKLREVQPEEPEIVDTRVEGVPKPPSAASHEAEALSPSEGIAATADEKRFFSRAFVLPREAWPIEPVADAQESVSQVEAHPARAAESMAQLRDFSVLVRLSRRTKKRMLLIYGSFGAVVLCVVGLIVYWSFSVDTSGARIVKRERGEDSTFQQILYEVPKRPPQRIVTTEAKEQEKRQVVRKAGQGESNVGIVGPPPPIEIERLAEVDPALKAEFKKYAGLLAGTEAARPEAAIDIKPRTLTEMPAHKMDREGMDAFFTVKMRKFADCKARMTMKTNMPVKVTLAFVVGTDGRVRDIVVEQTPGPQDKGLIECIRRIVSGWAFPPQDEETSFRRTLLF